MTLECEPLFVGDLDPDGASRTVFARLLTTGELVAVRTTPNQGMLVEVSLATRAAFNPDHAALVVKCVVDERQVYA